MSLDDDRRRRVRAVLEAARVVTTRPGRAALAAELQRSSRLSPEGVELALERHLELSVTDEDLARLLRRAERSPPPPRCHVLLSSNVCTGALRALAFASAVAERVVVRPSRRDPGLASALLGALEGGWIHATERLWPEPGDEVHLYGSDETLAGLAFDPRVRVLAFGSGFGVALPRARQEGAEPEAEALALAADVVPFDQRGCLSPRIALVPAAEAEVFAELLAAALQAAASATPRGELLAGELADVARFRRSALALGRVLQGEGFLVGVSAEVDEGALPPPCRAIQVVPCAESLGPRASTWARRATALGGGGRLFAAARELAPGARATPLGEMQRPPLDGPVDLRVRPPHPG